MLERKDNVDGGPAPEKTGKNYCELLTTICEKLNVVGKAFLLDQTPKKLHCVGFKIYHSSLNESPLYDLQPTRTDIFNKHHDYFFDGLKRLLRNVGKENLRVICEQFNKPIQLYQSDLARVWRVEQARVADTFGIRGKLSEALSAGGKRRHSVLEDRRGDTRFAAYCLDQGMQEVILQGQPTGYRGEVRFERAQETVREHAHKTVSDNEIREWIAQWKEEKDEDELLRHAFVQQQIEQSGLEEGVIAVLYGGAHFATGTRSESDTKYPLETYMTKGQRALIEPKEYAGLLPEQLPFKLPSDFSNTNVADVRRMLEGVRTGKLS